MISSFFALQGPVHAWEPKEEDSAAGSTRAAEPGAGPQQQASTSGGKASTVVHRASEQPASSVSARQWADCVPQGVRDVWQSVQQGEGVAGLSQAHTVAAAAGAVVLLYAGEPSFQAYLAPINTKVPPDLAS